MYEGKTTHRIERYIETERLTRETIERAAVWIEFAALNGPRDPAMELLELIGEWLRDECMMYAEQPEQDPEPETDGDLTAD